MSPIYRKCCLTLPLLVVPLLSLARPAAAQYASFFQYTGSAILNGQGLTGNFTAAYSGGGAPADTYFDNGVVYGSSIFTLQNGGSLGQLSGGDSTTLNIQGGSVGSVSELGSSSGLFTLNISGGNVFSTDLASVSGTETITGGTVGFLECDTPSIVNIKGGSAGLDQGIRADGNSVFNVSGGTVGNFTEVSGTLNFYGSSLAYRNGQVAGFLADGTPIDSLVPSRGLQVSGDANHLTLGPVPGPEASTSVSFGLFLLLGGAAAVYSSRRRRA